MASTGSLEALLARSAMITGLASFVLASAAVGQGASTGPSATHAVVESPAASSTPSLDPIAATVVVTAFDLGFDPAAIAIPATGSTRIVLTNTGRVVHNLTVDALHFLVVAPRGLSAEAIVTDPLPGVYEFYCSISGHKEGGMVGKLVVHESAPVEPTGAPSPSASIPDVTASG